MELETTAKKDCIFVIDDNPVKRSTSTRNAFRA